MFFNVSFDRYAMNIEHRWYLTTLQLLVFLLPVVVLLSHSTRDKNELQGLMCIVNIQYKKLHRSFNLSVLLRKYFYFYHYRNILGMSTVIILINCRTVVERSCELFLTLHQL